MVEKGAQTFDLGSLMVEDPESLDSLNDEALLQRTKANFCLLFKKLY